MPNTDTNEFLPLNYQFMFVKNAVATCVHFGYSLFCVLWVLILEETLECRGLFRTGSSKYCWVLEFVFISFSLFGFLSVSVFNHRSISTILCYFMWTLSPHWIGQLTGQTVFAVALLDYSSAGSTSQNVSNVRKLCTSFFSKNRLHCLVQVCRSKKLTWLNFLPISKKLFRVPMRILKRKLSYNA